MASSISESVRRRKIVARIAGVARAARVACALVAGAATMLAAAGPARADAPGSNETPVRRAARAKLVEGVDALRRGEHRVALDRFQEAYALVPSPKIHYDFGLAYLGLDRRAEALSAFERFLAEAPDAPADKRERAARQTTALRPQVGVVEIAVKGAPDGTAIAVDGREVGRAPLARSVYLDPGRHEIAVRPSGGGAGAVERIEVRAGARLEVVLRVEGAGTAVAGAAPAAVGPALPSAASPATVPVSTAPAPTVAAGPPPVGAEPADRGAGTRRIAALSLSAAGVVLIGAGVTFGALARSESNSLSRDSANGTPEMPTPFDPDKESRGTTYATLQVIGLAAGAVGLAAGIVLYATTRGRVTIEPAAGRAQAGANLKLSF
jgi:hypothetical protein